MSYFEDYASFISEHNFAQDEAIPDRLILRQTDDLVTYFAPFDYINDSARIFICDITPGPKQAVAALKAAQRQLNIGNDINMASKAAASVPRYCDTMVDNLVAMLDHIGAATLLGLRSTEELFDEKSHLVHYSSLTRYPVMVANQSFNGDPCVMTHPDLRWQLDTFLTEEVLQLRDALFVPLGYRVQEVFGYFASSGIVDARRILSGLPHPCAANAERIKYFLGSKPEVYASSYADASRIRRNCDQLMNKVAAEIPHL